MNGTLKKGSSMKSFIHPDEVKNMHQDRSKWKAVLSAYFILLYDKDIKDINQGKYVML